MKSVLFGFFIGGVVLLLHGVVETAINDHPIEQTKTFKVECKSFDFDGEVYRDGNKFYELIDGKEIWIPLGDCLLREVE